MDTDILKVYVPSKNFLNFNFDIMCLICSKIINTDNLDLISLFI